MRKATHPAEIGVSSEQAAPYHISYIFVIFTPSCMQHSR